MFNEYGSHGQWVKDNAHPKLDAENTIRDDRSSGLPVIGAVIGVLVLLSAAAGIAIAIVGNVVTR